jgi:hypothetical protein
MSENDFMMVIHKSQQQLPILKEEKKQCASVFPVITIDVKGGSHEAV